jgi:hypothetical protein
MTKMVTFLFLTISFSLTAAPHESCEPVDLSNRFGPVRDQGDTGWCGSFVVADLLTYQLGVRISAASTGINYYANRSNLEERLLNTAYWIEPGDYAAAFLSTSLSINLTRPVCAESEFDDSKIRTTKAEIFNDIGTLRRGQSLTHPLCEHPIDMSWIGLRVHGVDWIPNRSMSAIDDQLSLNNPVVAIVDSDKLFYKDAKAPPLVVRTFGDHFVSLVGRKPINGICHLLVRNSWGSGCDGYSAKEISSCEDGSLWIEQDHVASALKNVLYIDLPDRSLPSAH